MPCSCAISGDVAAQLDEPAHDVAGVAAHRRRDLEHRLHELGVDPRLELVPADRREHRVDVLDEVERLGVEELVLLLDAERVRVAGPNVWSSTLPACSAPLPVIDGRECLLAASRKHRLDLDLDLPARVEERREDGRVRGPHVGEDLAVRAREAVEVRRRR